MAKSKIGYLMYNVLVNLAAICGIPYLVIRNLIKRRPVWPYFQLPAVEELAKIQGKPVIWLQAVSVGETVVAKVILDRLRELLPEYGVVLTTTTPTGNAMARQILDDDLCIAYFPLDLPWLMRRFIKTIAPRLLILVEAELWPNVIRYAKASGSKVVLVNGMISDRSFKRYQRVAGFAQEVLAHFDLLAMQSAESANRIGKLGALRDRIMVTGNCKFDQAYPAITPEQIADLRRQYGWDPAIPIFTSASTHRGEEGIVLDAYQELIKAQPYQLILAPRHPERAEEVIALLKERQLAFVRRSAGLTPEKAPVLLLDTFGELGLAYAAAEVVFVGGSLVNVGGHNILEAAAQGKPVIYGPYMHKSRPSQQLLEEADAGYVARDSKDLTQRINALTADRSLYQKRAVSARAAVLSNQGAAGKTAALIEKLLREQ